MRIAVFNQDWFVQEWRDAGHDVQTFGRYTHMANQPPLLSHFDTVFWGVGPGYQPDVIVIHDDSSPFTYRGFEHTDIPVLFYSVDSHHHYLMHAAFSDCADATFVAMKDYIPHFESSGSTVTWFPLWSSVYVEPQAQKLYGASFVGTLNPKLNPQRIEFFDRLKSKVDVNCLFGNWPEVFPCSEIVINQTVKGDLNFRVFEAMISGALLLTERSGNGLNDLFTDGQHLVTYEKHNHEEAAEKIRYFLENKTAAREIAAAGRAEVMRAHRTEHRAATMLETLKSLKKRRGHKRCFGAAVNYVSLARALSKIEDAACLLALASALSNVEDGLKQSEILDEVAAAEIVAGAINYDIMAKSRAGSKLILQLAEAFPNQDIIGLCAIRSLLQSGDVSEASKRAAKYRDGNPGETYALIDQAVEQLFFKEVSR